jgi:cell division protein FtsB
MHERDTDYRTSAEGTTSKDVDYHNRLEQEVTQLKQENANWKQMNTVLDAMLKQAHGEIARLRLDNEQLRQAIAVLNDEPTNSL